MRDYILSMFKEYIGDDVKAESLLERLEEEGLIQSHYGDQETSMIVEAFKRIFGTTKVSKYDRFAAKRLARKHGTKAVISIMELLASKQNEKFAPVVGSVSQLEDKFVHVAHFLRGQVIQEDITL